MRSINGLVAGVFALTLAVFVSGFVAADELGPLKSQLQVPLLDPRQALAEVRSFLDAKIPKLPVFASRAAWETYAAKLRDDMFARVIFRGAAADWRDANVKIEWLETIPGGPGYHIRKVRFEALPGLWIPALLYGPDKLTGRVPVILNLGGHEPAGKAVAHQQVRCINLAKRGMLALNVEWIGMGQLRTPGFRHGCLNQIDLCGASGLAPFYLAMQRGIDVLLSHPQADAKRIAVTGLSGGGWQTIWISALDTRVSVADPVAGYTSLRTAIHFDDLGDSEQCPSDFATVGDLTHLTALRAPRATLLTFNAADDCCFKSDHTLEPLFAAARPVFALYAAKDRLRWHVNHVPGTHNYERENREVFYGLLDDYFYPTNAQTVVPEIPSDDELQTADQLDVPLPADNLDLQQLAVQLAASFPDRGTWPAQPDEFGKWQKRRRHRLIERMHIPKYSARMEESRPLEQDGLTITRYVVGLNSTWTVPVAEVRRAADMPRQTTIVIADGGRAAAAELIATELSAGSRVIAVDPLLFGESQVTGSDPQVYFALAIAAVGQRSVSIQAAQLAAIARLARQRFGTPVSVAALGPRASFAVTVAAAIETEAITAITLDGSLGSLRELIEENRTVEELPELFPFGLLAEFDLVQLWALVAPRPVRFVNPSQRLAREAAQLDRLDTGAGSPAPKVGND